MHCIKEAKEAQNSGQAELQSSRLEDKPTQQSKQPQHLRRLGKRHKAQGIGLLHRARDQRLIKRYNCSQHLCHDSSTIEGEPELTTSS